MDREFLRKILDYVWILLFLSWSFCGLAAWFKGTWNTGHEATCSFMLASMAFILNTFLIAINSKQERSKLRLALFPSSLILLAGLLQARFVHDTLEGTPYYLLLIIIDILLVLSLGFIAIVVILPIIKNGFLYVINTYRQISRDE